LRFTVRRPGNPVASPCSHGTPCRDVTGRIHVGVGLVPASNTPKDRLALAVVRCTVPTGRTGLRRERGIDPFYPTRRLVLQAGHQPPPTRGENASIQAGLGSHTPASLVDGSASRPGHARDVEVLHTNKVKPACQLGTGLLQPVVAPVGGFGLQLSNRDLQETTAVRPAFGTGQATFELPQPVSLTIRQIGAPQEFSSGQCGGHGHTAVHADDLGRARRRDRCGNDGECDMPAADPVAGDPIGLHISWNGACPAEMHPANFGYPHPACLPVQALDVIGSDSDLPEPFVLSGLAPSGSAVGASEEVGHGLMEVTQGLLLYRHAARCEPRVLGAGLGQLASLFAIGGGRSPSRPPVRVLLDGEIPHEPGVRAVRQQTNLLGGRRTQPVARHPDHHSQHYRQFRTPGPATTGPVPPWPVARGPHPLEYR